MSTYVLVTSNDARDAVEARRVVAARCPGIRWLEETPQIPDVFVIDLFEATPEEMQAAAEALQEGGLSDVEVWPSPQLRSARNVSDAMGWRPEPGQRER